MKKAIRSILICLSIIFISCAIFTIIDAHRIWYHTSAEISDKRISYKNNDRVEYCIEIHVIEQNYEAYIWKCSRFSYHLNWSSAEVGDKIIYQEKRWIWWWEQ